jgi:hypothetical protein
MRAIYAGFNQLARIAALAQKHWSEVIAISESGKRITIRLQRARGFAENGDNARVIAALGNAIEPVSILAQANL